MVRWYVWAGFAAAILLFLLVDLGLVHRRAHQTSFREALAWTGAWVGLAMVAAAGLGAWRGPEVAGQFLAGYLIEWSLSVDNVFVFLLILSHFAVPPRLQHRVLFWGVLGAISLRLVFILAGAALLHRFEWITYVFGAVLLASAVRFLRAESEVSLDRSRVLRIVRRLVPMTATYEGQRMFVRRDRRLLATPLFAVLVMIEAADIAFAVDSIPAIFSVTRDAFVVFASNALAILGLRSLYLVLARAAGRVRYLRQALAALLAFVGLKMLAAPLLHVPVGASLLVIGAILGLAVVLSVVTDRRTSHPRG